jgi:hypothetical protein
VVLPPPPPPPPGTHARTQAHVDKVCLKFNNLILAYLTITTFLFQSPPKKHNFVYAKNSSWLQLICERIRRWCLVFHFAYIYWSSLGKNDTYVWTWKGRHILKHIHQYFTFAPIFPWFIIHLNIDLQKSIFTNRCSWWNRKTSTCYLELNRFGTKQLLLFQRFDKHLHSNPKTP